MVGVAGKSQGCNSCRSRRIKCDLQRPDCNKCLNSGRSCPGYRRDAVFVNYDSTSAAKTPRYSSAPRISSTDDNDRPRSTVDDGITSRAARSQTKRKKPPETRLVVRVNDQHIFRELFASEFLRLYLPTSANSPRVPLIWPQLVFDVLTEGLALEPAMTAVSLSVVGNATNNPTLSIEGSKKYGQALWELQRALWDKRLMYKDETLAACNALILYELLECTASSLDGWISHSKGLTHLMEARGPESYDSPLAQMIYVSFRQVSMIQDIQYRRASTFTHPEWRSSPYRKHVKGPDQKLYDIGSELSTIIADADISKSMPSSQAFASKRLTLLEQCLRLNGEMDTWFEWLKDEIPPPHYWPEFSNFQNPVDDYQDRKTYPVSFRFPNLFIAKVLLDYWALSIILHSTIFQLYRSLMGEANLQTTRPEHPADDGRAHTRTNLPKSHTIPPPQVAQTPRMMRSLADNIAQSMEYCLSKDMGILGSQWALFPLRAALQTYRYFPDSKELLWLQAVHDRISDEKGVKFSRAIAAKSWVTQDTSP